MWNVTTLEVTNPQPAHRIITTRELINMKVEQASTKYGVSEDLLHSIIKCESGYRVDVYGDGGKAFSLLQFHKPTFEMFKKQAGMEQLSYTSWEDQIELGAWAFANGKQSHWTCFSKLYPQD